MKILEYIQSTGTQWLDTGIKPSTTTLIKAGVNVTEATGGVIVGHCNSDNSDYRIFNYQQTAYFDYGGSRISGSGININTYYDIEMGNYYLELNGTRALSGSTVTGTGDYQNHNILTGYSPAESVRTKMKLYYLQIYNNGDLVFDGVPAKDENDVVCFYDKVSGSFFYNQGTGDYTAGPEVVTEVFLIESGGDYYTISGGSLVNVGSTLNAQLFEDYGLNTAPDWSDYSSLANPSVLCWDEFSARSMTATTTGIPGATVAVSQKVPTGSGIQTVTINSDNDTLYSVSFDDGANWWKYANGAWVQVSAITDGMTKAEVEAISASAWEEKNTGFARFRFTLLDGNGYMTSIRVDYGGGGGGDSVSWTQVQQSGTKIAEIDINGTSQDVYAPNGGSTYTEGDGIDISAQNAISVDTAFTEASTRANIASGDTLATILGKIKKFFTDLKTVAFSGSYNDLSDKPTIPAAQVNSDWNASSGVAQILNKPTIPTKTSQLTNDSNYVTTSGSITGSSGSCTGNAASASLLSYSHTNEINFKGGKQQTIWFNYRNADTDEESRYGDWVYYKFCDYSRNTDKSILIAALFQGNLQGNAQTATKATQDGNGDTITSTYLKKAGDTASGTLNLETTDGVALNFRPNNADYYTTVSYQTHGNEACVIATKSNVTSFIFVNGEDSVTNHASNRWTSLTPGLQIKQNCVSIGALIGQNVTPTYKLNVNGVIRTNSDVRCCSVMSDSSSEWLPIRGGGAVTIRNYANSAYVPALASAFTVSSSRRYKENIVDMPVEDAERLLDMRVVNFDYKEGIIDGNRTGQKGLIAEEVAEIETFPVVYNQDGEVEGLDYSKFVPQLIKLCQMQQKQIDDLTARLEELERRFEE